MSENGNGEAKQAADIQLLVPAPLAQEILNYLQDRPHKEVHQMVARLIQCGRPHRCAPPLTDVTPPSAIPPQGIAAE